MSAVKGIIFDKDGTLFDFAATWEAWAQAFLLRACNGDRTRATQAGAVIGFDLQTRSFSRDSIVIAGTAGEVATALAPHFPDMTKPALLAMLNEEAEKAPQAEAVPLTPLLTALRDRGLKLGVATNDAQAPALAHLTGAGVASLLAFCAATGLEPQAVVMVGDSTHDLHAGRAAGMRTVAVLTGLAMAETLAPLADVVLADIGHLPAWLDDQA